MKEISFLILFSVILNLKSGVAAPLATPTRIPYRRLKSSLDTALIEDDEISPRKSRFISSDDPGARFGSISTTQKLPEGRVAFGSTAKQGEFPYVGYFDVDGGICTATLIAPRVALSAAHCVYDSEDKTWTNVKKSSVLFGSPDYYASSMKAYPAKRFLIPEDYQDGDYASGMLGDIAIIELAKAVPNIKPVTLATKTNPSLSGVKSLTIIGWGGDEDYQSPDIALYGSIPLFTKQECDVQYKKFYGGTIEPDHICTGLGSNGLQSCRGDSGGTYTVRQPSVLQRSNPAGREVSK